jgi:hypothetical protein
MVFGPLEGDGAGILYVDTSQVIEVDLWMRTAPGISIVGFHIPLSSKDEYIRSDSREGGEYCELLYTWDDVFFFTPNSDPVHSGYTNQSFFGIEFVEPDCDNGIITDGWWWIASFNMTTVGTGLTGQTLCDAFMEGFHPDQQDNALLDCHSGVLDPSQIQMDFACLWINEVACSEYTIGDYNGSGAFNVADIVDSYSRLKTGLPEPATICECPAESGDYWAVAADVNNSCAFNVADVVDGYSKLKTGSPELAPCEDCPPESP